VNEAPSHRVLDPIDRVSEILFGLIMVLTFTCSLSVATAGREEIREMLVGAIGCNMAWGIVDAVMFVMANVLERCRGLATIRAVGNAPNPERGRTLIADELPPVVASLIEREHLESIREKLVRLKVPATFGALRFSDLRGAWGVFLLVFTSTIPVVLPFVFVADAQRALRLSNTVAIVMLFLGGFFLARRVGLRPIQTGFALVAIGVVLVLLTMALGG
jgi:hypothetical protein